MRKLAQVPFQRPPYSSNDVQKSYKQPNIVLPATRPPKFQRPSDDNPSRKHQPEGVSSSPRLKQPEKVNKMPDKPTSPSISPPVPKEVALVKKKEKETRMSTLSESQVMMKIRNNFFLFIFQAKWFQKKIPILFIKRLKRLDKGPLQQCILQNQLKKRELLQSNK